MVKELPVSNGEHLLVTIAGTTALGYQYAVDDKYLYCVAHISALGLKLSARTVEITFDAKRTVAPASVIAENKTQSVVVLAAKRPHDWAAPNQKEIGQVRTGDTVRFYTLNGSVGAQVLDAYWSPAKGDGVAEVYEGAKPLHATIGLAYSDAYAGLPCLTADKRLLGFVHGKDLETNQIVMVRADGFEKFLQDTKDAFAKFMKDKGYNLEDIFTETTKYDDVRLKLASVGVQFFLGLETIAMGTGSSACIHVIDVPTVVNVQRRIWEQPSYKPGVEALVLTPANSNAILMKDFNRYRSTASCTLVALRWAEPETGLNVEIKEGMLHWAFAQDIAASAGLRSITAKIQWVPADGRPTTKDYIFECDTEVEDTLPNGLKSRRRISQLSSLVTNQVPRFMRMPAGTLPTTIDAFVSSQTHLGTVPYWNHPIRFHINPFPINHINPFPINPINPFHFPNYL